MESGLIYEALTRVMESMSASGKDKYNEQQKFKYRGIDDAYNAIHTI